MKFLFRNILAAMIAYTIFIIGVYFLSDWKNWCKGYHIKTNFWTYLKITFLKNPKNIYVEEIREENKEKE